ncbi:N5,N10-methylene tetrahydromethanopterin reductase [Ktedonobacter sp. SOSP1-85]|uniref:LLM class flavin-dependent oxidoreductase n=1 Tax=Ktedonobacter sp. SOSP1-85 TaxID=2778367 RepID=UPI0019159E52|nr:LLM class flavin-dependent oxidoreductase [Ktedonobacter sp. SOSP1-85]GHO80479.1 N5,N10-methylene tetrahydromethanopterin reductase [Ktedonobacter sp. SOSP1-85]
MRTLQFGISLEPGAADASSLRELVRLADTVDLDLCGIQDHPYVPQYLDTMSLIATLLAETRKLRFFPNVANLPMHQPALFAKEAATIDLLSGGRFELGIGAGAFWDGIVALGGPRRAPGEAIQALEEAIIVMRAFWSGQRGQRFSGKYYSLHGAHGGPQPAHPIGIWIGSVSEKMLGLTGRLADGWAAPIVSYLPYERWKWAQEKIDNGAREVGRDPSSIVRVANLVGHISNSGTSAANRPLQGHAPLEGTSTYWAEVLTALGLEDGFDTFVYWPQEPSQIQIERFAREVVPAVRTAVAKERSA